MHELKSALITFRRVASYSAKWFDHRWTGKRLWHIPDFFYKEPGWCEELVKCQQGAVYPHWVRVAKTLINLTAVDRTQTSVPAYICSHSAMSEFRFYRSSFTNTAWTNLIPKAYLFHFNKSEKCGLGREIRIRHEIRNRALVSPHHGGRIFHLV